MPEIRQPEAKIRLRKEVQHRADDKLIRRRTKTGLHQIELSLRNKNEKAQNFAKIITLMFLDKKKKK